MGSNPTPAATRPDHGSDALDLDDELRLPPGPVTTDAATNAHPQDPTLAQNRTRTAAGYTVVTAPCQQPGAGCAQTQTPSATSTVYYDDFGHPTETVDPLGHKTQAGYNDHNELLWSEDALGNPTDNSIDTVNDVVLSSQGPDPDGAGPLGRPVTSYRYDETQIGTACSPNDGGCGTQYVLAGLRAAYYKNKDFSGRPDVLETDPTVDFSWGSGGPLALGGFTDNFSVRWAGDLVVSGEGDYTFSVVSDGNTGLTVDGVQAATDPEPYTAAAISDTQSHDPMSVSSQPLHLAPGLHPLTLEYADLTGSSQIRLRYSCANCSPAVSDQVIPASALRRAWLNETSVVSPLGTAVLPRGTCRVAASALSRRRLPRDRAREQAQADLPRAGRLRAVPGRARPGGRRYDLLCHGYCLMETPLPRRVGSSQPPPTLKQLGELPPLACVRTLFH